MSKFDYFVRNREDAKRCFETEVAVFGDTSVLLSELRLVFDWIAEENSAQRVSSRKFKQRLPEIHKRFPLLANNFARADANGDCWLEWKEFANFCLKDERIVKMMKRQTSICTYGIDFNGIRTFKDRFDAAHTCEMSSAPPLLPWESSHLVEWRIEGLRYSSRGLPTTYWGHQIYHGQCLVSPPFRAGGVWGSLRFWPVSYWTETQQWKKRITISEKTSKDAMSHAPASPGADAWCAVGVNLPSGSHMQFRLFVGSTSSDVRTCYCSKGVDSAQVWAPIETKPPTEVQDLDESEHITVGIEIFQNKGAEYGKPGVKRLSDKARLNFRPPLKEIGMPMPKASVLLSRNASLPFLNPTKDISSTFGTGGSLDKTKLSKSAPDLHSLLK